MVGEVEVKVMTEMHLGSDDLTCYFVHDATAAAQ